MINVVLPDGRVKQTESAASRWMSIALKWDEKTPELPQTMSCTVKSALNIHSGAGADTPVIGTLKHGDKIKVSADENDWLRFTMEDGTIGYVWDEYMAVVE